MSIVFPSVKLSARALGSVALGAGLMWAVVGCQSESSESPETTTTTTTTTETTEATNPEPTEPALVPTTKGSLDPVGPGAGDKFPN